MRDYLYPHPECMAPDGADPCTGYKNLLAEVERLENLLADVGSINLRLMEQLAELREGIKEHSQCFNADEGDPHDLALWSLLNDKDRVGE